MKRTVLLFCVIVLCLLNGLHAQPARLDSLLTANAAHPKEDSFKVLLLIDIGKEYRKQKKTKERFEVIDAAILLGEKIKFYRPLAAQYNYRALWYEGLGEYEKSIVNYERAIELCRLLGDKKYEADYSLNYGTVYQTLADYPRALSLYQQAANYYISIGSDGDAALCYVNMGGVYNEFPGHTQDALDHLAKAAKIFLREDEKRGVAETYMSMVTTYSSATPAELQQLHIDSARRYAIKKDLLSKAMALSVEIKDEELGAEVRDHLGKMEEERLHYEAALKEYTTALQIFEKLEHRGLAIAQMLNIGRVYKEKKNFPVALSYLRTALNGARDTKMLDVQRDVLLNIGDIHEASRRYDSAHLYYKEYIVLRDSVSNSDKQKEITRKQIQFEFGAKERDYKLNEQIAETRIRGQRNLNIFMAVMIVLLSAAGVIVYRAKQRTAKLNKVVLAQKEELEEMGKVKDKIFSIVSHDMRTPVNNIIAFSSLLEDGDIEQDRLALYLEQIKGTLDHTSSLMENMLNWAASQMQGFTPVAEDVNMAPLVQHVFAGIEPSLHKKRIQCRNLVNEDILVKGDQNMIELIIRNLLNNAIKFSNPGGEMELFAKKENENVIISVRDNGVGMKQELVDVLNSSSAKSVQSSMGTGKEKGTGLGLMLCKHFAVMMHGRIKVESEEGKGSVFSLVLPSA